MAALQNIPVSKIVPSPFQPRESFEKSSLEELAASIKGLDLLQPIIVRPHKSGYQIAAGERRWRAAQMAGLSEVAAIVKDMDDRTLQLYSLVENLHRLDLAPPEKEKAIHDLWKKHYEPEGFTQARLAKDLGLDASTISLLVLSHTDRTKIKSAMVREKVSTDDLHSTRGLPEQVRKELLEKKAKGEIAQKDMERVIPVLRDAKPERAPAILKEVAKQVKEAEEFKEEVMKEATAFGRGEIEATRVKVVKEADLRRLDDFKGIRNEVRFWTVAGVEMIKDDKLRMKVVDEIRSIREFCDRLLGQLEKRKWFKE